MGVTQGFSRKDYGFIVSIYNRHFQGTIFFNDLRLAGIRYLQMLPQPVTVITYNYDLKKKTKTNMTREHPPFEDVSDDYIFSRGSL